MNSKPFPLTEAPTRGKSGSIYMGASEPDHDIQRSQSDIRSMHSQQVVQQLRTQNGGNANVPGLAVHESYQYKSNHSLKSRDDAQNNIGKKYLDIDNVTATHKIKDSRDLGLQKFGRTQSNRNNNEEENGSVSGSDKRAGMSVRSKSAATAQSEG